MTEAKKRETPMVSPARVQLAEYAIRHHVITAESSEHPEDFRQPEFYAHVAKQMRQYDHVEIRTDDGTYWARGLVEASDLNWAKVRILEEVKMQDAKPAVDDDRFFVKWNGPHLKWCVMRHQDKAVLREGERDKAAAIAWMESHLRTVGRKAA